MLRVSLAMTSGASATAPTNTTSQDNARQIFLGEEEIADVSLATFHVFVAARRRHSSVRKLIIRILEGPDPYVVSVELKRMFDLCNVFPLKAARCDIRATEACRSRLRTTQSARPLAVRASTPTR